MSATSGAATPTRRLKTQSKYRAENALVIASASGRWPEILIAQGISEQFLSGKHSACPICRSGTDRFRFDNKNGEGTYFCNQCGSGDGFNLISKYLRISNREAFIRVAQYLNLNAISPSKENNEKQLGNPIKQPHNQLDTKLEIDQKLLTKKKVAYAHADNILSYCVMRPHPYLIQKGINQSVLVSSKNYKVTDKQTVYANALIIPVYDINNHQQLIGAQFINADGSRAYIASTLIAEGIHVIQGNDKLSFIGVIEGYATALSVFMATEATIIVAFDANGIEGKAERLKDSFSGKQLVFFADNDTNNVGQKAAHAAANKTNGLVITPPDTDQDWNDHHQANGLEATKIEIDKQLKTQRAIKELEMSIIDVDTTTKVVEQTSQAEDLFTGISQQFEEKKTKFGFVLEKNALVFYKETSDGTIKVIPVSSRIEITAKQSDLYTGGNTGLTLKFKNIFDREMTWSMPRSILAEDKTITAALCALGAVIHDKRLFNHYLMQENPKQELFCVDRIGWHHMNGNHFFVLPDKTSGHHKDKEKLVYQSKELNTLFNTRGTIEQWRENVSKLCAGNSRLVFALSHGLASMLLSPTNSTNGGINLFGESSTGKTTIARVCGSIFSDLNYVESCRTTTNALENTAHSHNDCLLILDEISQMNSKDMGDTVYTLCNGMGKARMRANADSQPIIKFRNNYLFTGEIPVSQHTREGGNRETEGQLVRVLDIPAVVGEHGVFDCLPEGTKSGADFSNYLKEQSTRYYGTCVIAFLEELTKPQNIIKIPEKLKQVKEQLIENLPQKVQGQTERAINRFALAACAGELATEWGLTGWHSGEAITSARKCLDAWLTERGGVENKEGSKLLQQVRAFFATNGESRFTDINNQEQSKTINRAGFKELINDEWIYYVYPNAFEEIHKGFTKTFAIKTLRESNWIETTINTRDQIEVCKQKKIPKHGNGRFYTFNKLMWE